MGKSSHKRENFKGGYKTTDTSSRGTKTERVYKTGKYIFSPDTLKSKKVTK